MDIVNTVKQNIVVIGKITIQEIGINQKPHNGKVRSKSIMPPLKNIIEKKTIYR